MKIYTFAAALFFAVPVGAQQPAQQPAQPAGQPAPAAGFTTDAAANGAHPECREAQFASHNFRLQFVDG